MSVAGTETLARDLESLLDSQQGEMLASASDFFRTRVKRFAMTFIVGMIVGYPIAGMALTWLLSQANLVPNEVSIVVLQPLEVVILQLRLAAHYAV